MAVRYGSAAEIAASKAGPQGDFWDDEICCCVEECNCDAGYCCCWCDCGAFIGHSHEEGICPGCGAEI